MTLNRLRPAAANSDAQTPSAPTATSTAPEEKPEEIKFEGSGSQIELALSLLLGFTILYLVRQHSFRWIQNTPHFFYVDYG
jgi:hypothetical protein